MANALYDTGRAAFLTAAVNWSSDNIKAALVKTTSGYTVSLSADQFLSTIVSGNRIAISANLASKTTTAGVADAADVTFSAVTGAACGAVVIYKDTGTDTTSQLIAYIDTATGLPVTPNGGDITVSWDNGSNKIFKL
jgi:hypothetical protein